MKIKNKNTRRGRQAKAASGMGWGMGGCEQGMMEGRRRDKTQIGLSLGCLVRAQAHGWCLVSD